jgi:hypothetical protein
MGVTGLKKYIIHNAKVRNIYSEYVGHVVGIDSPTQEHPIVQQCYADAILAALAGQGIEGGDYRSHAVAGVFNRFNRLFINGVSQLSCWMEMLSLPLKAAEQERRRTARMEAKAPLEAAISLRDESAAANPNRAQSQEDKETLVADRGLATLLSGGKVGGTLLIRHGRHLNICKLGHASALFA